MSSKRQFLLSLLATTMSIVLTFGTAAIIDYNKKQREKHEIVMMVMYDMYNSLKSVEEADSMIDQLMDYPLQIAEDTSKFNSLRFVMVRLTPKIEYTETAEQIFSSSIETINTVGNVLFNESVAQFYQTRKQYKAVVCDSVSHNISLEKPFNTLSGFLNYDWSWDAIVSRLMVTNLRQLFAQCKQMMDISDEELDAYREEREQMEKSKKAREREEQQVIEEFTQLQERINEASSSIGE